MLRERKGEVIIYARMAEKARRSYFLLKLSTFILQLKLDQRLLKIDIDNDEL